MLTYKNNVITMDSNTTDIQVVFMNQSTKLKSLYPNLTLLPKQDITTILLASILATIDAVEVDPCAAKQKLRNLDNITFFADRVAKAFTLALLEKSDINTGYVKEIFSNALVFKFSMTLSKVKIAQILTKNIPLNNTLDDASKDLFTTTYAKMI